MSTPRSMETPLLAAEVRDAVADFREHADDANVARWGEAEGANQGVPERDAEALADAGETRVLRRAAALVVELENGVH